MIESLSNCEGGSVFRHPHDDDYAKWLANVARQKALHVISTIWLPDLQHVGYCWCSGHRHWPQSIDHAEDLQSRLRRVQAEVQYLRRNTVRQHSQRRTEEGPECPSPDQQ